LSFFFFFNDTATTEIYTVLHTLSLHDALPISVGDVAFQRKCLGKMQEVAQHGRTVIFVSHNLPSIVDLTDRAILLEHGRLVLCGPSHEVASHFLGSLRDGLRAGDVSAYRHPYRDEGWVDIKAVTVCGDPLGGGVVLPGGVVEIDVDLTIHRPVENGIVVVNLLDERLDIVATFSSFDDGYFFAAVPGALRVHCELGPAPLAPGNYLVSVGAAQPSRLAWDAVKALPGFRMGGEDSPDWLRWPERPGVVFLPRSKWR
jgi:lipopolysaccharide transport system ATP-binding protein